MSKLEILAEISASHGHTFFTFISERDFRVTSNRNNLPTGEMVIVEDGVKLFFEDSENGTPQIPILEMK